MADFVSFPKRGLVCVSGPDAATLLDGLLTRNVEGAGAEACVYTAMLTPQGKFLFELFIIVPETGTYWIDVSDPASFAKRLSLYRLRSKVTIEDKSASYAVGAVWRAEALPPNAVQYPDPRHGELPQRFIAPCATLAVGDEAAAFRAYEQARLGLGVPDLAADLLVEKDFILEGLMDEMGGVDFHKGCYVGQEMTSRMKRRTTVKTKLCRVRFDGAAPAFETPILADGWEVGRMRTGASGQGLALIRFDRAQKARSEGQELRAGDQVIRLDPPNWMEVPA
jgi:folate-binding protein YgfZ